MMDLETFIAQSLIQIANGVEKASDALKSTSTVINPKSVSGAHKGDMNVFGYLDTQDQHLRTVQKIEFDVAVLASEGKETKGGIGIVVGSIGLGTQGKSESESSSHSRIKFTIPMALPIPK
jgi:hypothetical protein